jgi:hypothetical protein
LLLFVCCWAEDTFRRKKVVPKDFSERQFLEVCRVARWYTF